MENNLKQPLVEDNGKENITSAINVNIGHALRRLRECQFLTVEEVAAQTEYSPDKYKDIENGGKRINLHTFIRLVKTLGGRLCIDTPRQQIPVECYYDIPPFPDTDTPPPQSKSPILSNIGRKSAQLAVYQSQDPFSNDTEHISLTQSKLRKNFV